MDWVFDKGRQGGVHLLENDPWLKNCASVSCAIYCGHGVVNIT